MARKKKRVLIRTPFPTVKKTAKKLGVSQKELQDLLELVREGFEKKKNLIKNPKETRKIHSA